MDNKIKKYTTKTGKTLYKIAVYNGKDENTGRSKMERRQGFKDEASAMKEYLKISNAIADGTYNSKTTGRKKFSEIYDLWATSYAETVKESTYATTVRIMKNHVLPELGNIYLDKITPLMCQSAVNKWFKQAPKTYKKYIRYSSSVFNYARRLKMINENPMDSVFRPKVKETVHKPKYNFYTRNELKTFLHFAKKLGIKPYTFFFVMSFCGLRRGEMLGLKWSDIDFNKKTLTVNRTASRGLNNRQIIQTPKTYNSWRVLDLDSKTVSILKEWQIQQRKEMAIIKLNQDLYIFDGTVKGYPANVPMLDTKPNKWDEKISEMAGIRHIRVHDFRHTHASLLFESGASMQDVKDRLGHSSIKTTMDIYTHITQSRRKETTKKFSEYMQL